MMSRTQFDQTKDYSDDAETQGEDREPALEILGRVGANTTVHSFPDWHGRRGDSLVDHWTWRYRK
jgi:hypothetical protein